jgi:hypothetical protein
MTEVCCGKPSGTAECHGTRNSRLLRWIFGACLSATTIATAPFGAHAQSIGFGPAGINIGGIRLNPYYGTPRRSSTSRSHDQAKTNDGTNEPKDPNTETLLTNDKNGPATVGKDASAKATGGKDVVERTSSSENQNSSPPSVAPRTEGHGPDFAPEQ